MDTSVQRLWDNCLNVIKDNIPEAAFKTWFLPIIPLSYENKVFTIQVPSQFFYEYLEEKFFDLLKVTLLKEIGKGTTLQYRVLMENTTNTVVDYRGEAKSIAVEKLNKKGISKIPNPFEKVIENDFDSQLNAKYTFDNFFEGESNKLARTAGLAIAKNPGKTAFNPLFVHGGSGVGKTHLCHAIGAAIKEAYPEKKVLYVSAHLFKIQYADAGRYNTTNDFINFYQSIDVLILDDIHELSGIEKTLNTLFHIFNHLHQNNKQLILTSDKAPSELQGVESRLLTRFRWGLTTKIENTDKQLRHKILSNRILNDGLSIPSNVVDYIVENVTDNARDIEGITVSIMAHALVYNKEIDLPLAKSVITQSIKRIESNKKITLENIESAVCSYYNINCEQIRTNSRKREIVLARQIAMYLTKAHTELSLNQIGSQLGKKNHATVLHACKTIKTQMEVNATFKNEVEEIESRLKINR